MPFASFVASCGESNYGKMPLAPPRSCKCGLKVEAGQRCPRCTKEHRQRTDEQRGNFRQRGYTTQWDHLRRRYLAENPLCERHRAKGLYVMARLVHHIKPVNDGGPMFDWSNLMSLCDPCHDEIHVELRRAQNA